MTAKKITGLVLFSDGADPAGAVAALRRAGYTVVRVPLDETAEAFMPGDVTLEATKLGTDVDTVWDEINRIAKCFQGECPECMHLSPEETEFWQPRLAPKVEDWWPDHD